MRLDATKLDGNMTAFSAVAKWYTVLCYEYTWVYISKRALSQYEISILGSF